jgi:hypothetical protein
LLKYLDSEDFIGNPIVLSSQSNLLSFLSLLKILFLSGGANHRSIFFLLVKFLSKSLKINIQFV